MTYLFNIIHFTFLPKLYFRFIVHFQTLNVQIYDQVQLSILLAATFILYIDLIYVQSIGFCSFFILIFIIRFIIKFIFISIIKTVRYMIFFLIVSNLFIIFVTAASVAVITNYCSHSFIYSSFTMANIFLTVVNYFKMMPLIVIYIIPLTKLLFINVSDLKFID